jgi:hypothetical protein
MYSLREMQEENYLLLDLISHIDHLRSSVVTKLSLSREYKVIKIFLAREA